MRQSWLARWVCGLLLLASALRAVAASEEEAAKRAAQTAREAAKQAGFKLELREFAFQLTPEEQGRAAVITNAGFALKPLRSLTGLEWMEPVVGSAARCGWQSERNWEQVATDLQTVAAPLDAAAEVLRADRPLRFVPQGPSLLLPHLAGLKSLADAFTARMAFALRAGNQADAWTNLLATTALATRYEPEPCEISHLVRLRLMRQAFAATWEALQTNVWTDRQLAELTAQWSQVDLFRGVEEVPMLHATQMLLYTAAVRGEYLTNSVVTPGLSRLFRQGLSDPGRAWGDARGLIQYASSQKDYARKGSYLDEAIIIGFYRKQAGLFHRAATLTNWLAIRALPGATNQAFLQLTTNTPSPLQSLVNSRALAQAFAMRANGGVPTTVLGWITETEARRRVLLTALAVERVRRRTGQGPKSLEEVPGALRDFINGEPLRYRLEPDGNPVVHSPGLDLMDNGGALPRFADLVWPRRATDEEITRWGPGQHLLLYREPMIDPGTGNLVPATQPLPPPPGDTLDAPP